MHRISLHAAQDHILGLTRFRTPIVAVEELIWNSLDADASNVRVSLTLNKMSGLTKITVSDDGHGLPASDCDAAFGSIGGSPKLKISETPLGRRPHGRTGRGRLKAFGLGNVVKWQSRFKDNGTVKEYSIAGHKSRIDSFEIGDPVECKKKKSGVTVEILGIDGSYPSLVDSKAAASELAQRLALYLNQYPGITIVYDDVVVDAATGQSFTADYPIEVRVSPSEAYTGVLTVIEWDRATTRALYLCDSQGFARDERAPGIQAKGWNFTAYFKSDFVEKLDEDNLLAFDELHPSIKAIIDASKDALRSHFRKRESLKSSDLVRQWKEEEVYPYQTTTDPVKTAEREVFDVCAVNVAHFLPNFDSLERANKRFTFQLLKQAIESNPTALQTILREVLALPKEKQDEFARLLDRTKLSAIINAANVVVERLDFLASLDELLFGQQHNEVSEVRQLHPILANELWLFGEQYQLGIDEGSLRKTLEKHIEILGREELVVDTSKVKDIDGKDRYLDLLLYRRYPQMTHGHFEHLVIELKRPSVTLGQTEINQVENYAHTVSDDSRFDKKRTNWTFLLIGNELDKFAKDRCESPDRAPGHIKVGRVNIHVRTWSDTLGDATWRYEFFRKQLEYKAKSGEGLGFLHERYAEYFPEVKRNKKATRQSTDKKAKPRSRVGSTTSKPSKTGTAKLRRSAK